MYRIGLSALLAKMRQWILKWCPDEVVGGVPGKSADWIYQPFAMDAETSKENEDDDMVGIKLDLTKCFDLLRYQDANEMLARLGAPRRLLRLLEMCDTNQVRHVEYQGAVDGQPIRPRRSLAQGCPASPLRLAVIMAAWDYFMTARCRACRRYVFVDDRVLWKTGKICDRLSIHAELTANHEFEQCFWYER